MLRETWKVIFFKRGYLFPVLLGIVAFPATADMLNKAIHYKSIKPGCEQMFSYDECMEKNATFKVYRDIRKMKIKQERIDLGEYFEKCLEGIYQQTYQNWECVVNSLRPYRRLSIELCSGCNQVSASDSPVT